MPTVPISELTAQGSTNPLTGKPPSETDVLMALAEMKNLGRLNPPAPKPNAKPARRTPSPLR